MSVYFKTVAQPLQSLRWIIIALLVSVLPSVAAFGAEKTPIESHHTGIIVLDPGHGGNDMGARGYENMIEKQVTMAFAGLMTERLKKTYKVVLTRKDDYQIDLFDRAALANHMEADLFVSLHTGASLRSFPRGMSLFYYNGPFESGTALDPLTSIPTEASHTIRPWEQNRPDLVEKSRHLVELIRKRLIQTDKTLKLNTSGAPLIVMSGADMPAVLIEIGTITNPQDAKALSDKASLSKIANAICDAIDDFF